MVGIKVRIFLKEKNKERKWNGEVWMIVMKMIEKRRIVKSLRSDMKMSGIGERIDKGLKGLILMRWIEIKGIEKIG